MASGEQAGTGEGARGAGDPSLRGSLQRGRMERRPASSSRRRGVAGIRPCCFLLCFRRRPRRGPARAPQITFYTGVIHIWRSCRWVRNRSGRSRLQRKAAEMAQRRRRPRSPLRRRGKQRFAALAHVLKGVELDFSRGSSEQKMRENPLSGCHANRAQNEGVPSSVTSMKMRCWRFGTTRRSLRTVLPCSSATQWVVPHALWERLRPALTC